MVSANTFRTIIGIIGNVISFGLFLSPAPVFVRIIKRKSVEEFQPYAYLATSLNCMFWILYGIPVVHPDSTLVVTINCIGLVMELIYLSIYCLYDRQNTKRKVVGSILSVEVMLVGVIALVALLNFHTHSTRSLFVGVICDIFNIIMYASPLTIWKKVIKTKSVEYMPFWLSLAGFANGCIWTGYSLIKFDYFILISNSIGTFLGVIQLIIYACYCKPNSQMTSSHANGVARSEVELPRSSMA